MGSISGGCLEGDVAEIARDVLETGRPRLVNYDMTSDDDAVWGLGLGCNGAIDVFVEAVSDARGDEMVALLRDSVEHRRTIALATVIAAPQGGVEVGARLIVPADLVDGRAQERSAISALDCAACARRPGSSSAVRCSEATGRSRRPGAPSRCSSRSCPRRCRCWSAGPATTRCRSSGSGIELGWWVMVADSRPAFASRERFPDADEVVLAADVDVPRKVRIDPDTFAILMTHNYLHRPQPAAGPPRDPGPLYRSVGAAPADRASARRSREGRRDRRRRAARPAVRAGGA